MTDDTPTILQQINADLRDERDRYQRQAAWQRRQMSILRDEIRSIGTGGLHAPTLVERLESIIHGAPVDDPATIEALQHDLAAERAACAETQRRLETYEQRSQGFGMEIYPTPYGWTFLSCGTLTDGFASAWAAGMAGAKVLLDTVRDIPDNPIRVHVNGDPGDEQPEEGE